MTQSLVPEPPNSVFGPHAGSASSFEAIQDLAEYYPGALKELDETLINNDFTVEMLPSIGVVVLRGALNPDFTKAMIDEAELAGFSIPSTVTVDNVDSESRLTTGIFCMGNGSKRSLFAQPHKDMYPTEPLVLTSTFANKYAPNNDFMRPHLDGLATSPSVFTGFGAGGIKIDPQEHDDEGTFWYNLAKGNVSTISYGPSDLMFFDGRSRMHLGYREYGETRYSIVAFRQDLRPD